MLIYFLPFLLSSFFSIFLSRFKKKNLWFFVMFALTLAPVVLLATFRVGIGTDYYNYKYFYFTARFGRGYEPFFVLLNFFAKWLFNDFKGVLFLSSVLSYGVILVALLRLKNQLYVPLGLFIYYCYYYCASLNVMRQLIAVSFIFLGLVFLFEKKSTLFLICLIVASMFHLSSFVCLLFYFIYKIVRSSKKYGVLFYFVLLLIFCFISRYVLEYVFTLGFFEDYSHYYHTSSKSFLMYMLDNIDLFMIVLVPILLNRIFLSNREEDKIIRLIGLASLLVIIVGYNLSWFKRVYYYFDVVQVLLCPLTLKRLYKSSKWFADTQKSKLFSVCIVIAFVGFYAFFFWYSSIYRGSNGCFPYKY